MELISVEGKTSFFERRVSEYSLSMRQNNTDAHSGSGKESEEDAFDEDF